MVVDAVYDLMDSNLYMLVAGLVLLLAGYQGVVNPDGWVLAIGMAGELFNLLPDVVHQILGGLIGFSGLSQVFGAVEEYL